MTEREVARHRRATTTTATTQVDKPDSTCLVRQLRRRRAASWRLPGGDPWYYDPPGMAGYEETAAHLLELGLTPAPHVAALKSMWKAGGDSRAIAQLIVERWGLVA